MLFLKIPDLERTYGTGHITVIWSSNKESFFCVVFFLSSVAQYYHAQTLQWASMIHFTSATPRNSRYLQGKLRLFQVELLHLHVPSRQHWWDFVFWSTVFIYLQNQWRKYQTRSQGLGLLSSQVKTKLVKRSLYTSLCLSFSLLKQW